MVKIPVHVRVVTPEVRTEIFEAIFIEIERWNSRGRVSGLGQERGRERGRVPGLCLSRDHEKTLVGVNEDIPTQRQPQACAERQSYENDQMERI